MSASHSDLDLFPIEIDADDNSDESVMPSGCSMTKILDYNELNDESVLPIEIMGITGRNAYFNYCMPSVKRICLRLKLSLYDFL